MIGVEELALFVKDEPQAQAALAAFAKGINYKWCVLQRTVPNTASFTLQLIFKLKQILKLI